MKRIILSICFLILTNLAIGKEASVNYAESLSNNLTKFHRDMRKNSTETRRKALQNLFPSQADLKILFPNDADMLWAKLSVYQKKMLQHIDQVAKELNRDEWIEIKTIDVRKNDPSGRYKNVLKVIPENIPIFRVIRKGKKRSAGSSSYLYINGRWIHLQGLEMIPMLIARSKTVK